MRKQLTILLTSVLSILFCPAVFADWELVESDYYSRNDSWRYEQNGQYLTNQWMKREREWYYLGEDGITLSSITQMIDGVEYTFNSDGEWTRHSKLQYQDGLVTYTNLDFNYSIEYDRDNASFPDDIYNSWGTEIINFDTGRDGYMISIRHYPRSQFPNFSEGSVNSILYDFGAGSGREIDIIKKDKPVHVNGFTFEKKYVATTDSSGYKTVYTHTGKSGSIVIIAGSFDHKMEDEKSSEIVASIRIP